MTQIETPQERAKRTRRENKAKREERRREFEEQRQVDVALSVLALRRIRDNENSDPAAVLEAIKLIDVFCNYHHIPAAFLSSPRSGNEPDMEWFAEQVAAIQAKYERPNA